MVIFHDKNIKPLPTISSIVFWYKPSHFVKKFNTGKFHQFIHQKENELRDIQHSAQKEVINTIGS